jgi:hypothetical protein
MDKLQVGGCSLQIIVMSLHHLPSLYDIQAKIGPSPSHSPPYLPSQCLPTQKIEKKKEKKKKGEILSHTDEEKRGVGGSRQATTATTPPLDISKLKPHAICFIK